MRSTGLQRRISARWAGACWSILATAIVLLPLDRSEAQSPAQPSKSALNRATAPAAAAPGDVDLARSRTYMKVDKTGAGHVHAVVGTLSEGRLNLGAKSGAGKFVFDMGSLSADTADARKFVGLEGETDESTQKQVNDNMRGTAVLSVKKYPEAVFDIDSALPVPKAEAGTYELSGKFTLHGTTKPLKVVVKTATADKSIHVSGQFPLKQTDFGIKPYSKLFGAIGVADELTVFGDLWIAPGK